MPNIPSAQKKAEMADRRYKALLLVRQGKTYEQIGQVLKVSHETARKDVEAALKDRTRPAAEAVRKLHIIRAEWVWEQASDIVVNAPSMDQKLRALDRCSVALERLAKLDGVDAPLRSEITLTNDTIKAEIAEIEARLASGDLEVVE